VTESSGFAFLELGDRRDFKGGTEARAAESVTARVARTIGMAIARGDYAPGANLPVEAELCRSLRVGRNVLREAVKTLAGKGLLRTVRRTGTVVQPKNQWNLLDPDVLRWTLAADALRYDLLLELTRLRAMIEPEVAAMAAKNATTTETLRLYEAYEAMRRHRNDSVLAIETDLRFHRCLFAGAHSQLVASLFRSFSVLLRANFELTLGSKGGYIRNLEQHGDVAEAVHRRDPDAARRAMLRLLANNEADLAEVMQRGGPGSRGESRGSRRAAVQGKAPTRRTERVRPSSSERTLRS
jgi:DNA-binding FadR family transcriptional regulator